MEGKSVESKIRYIVEKLWKPDADYMFFNWAQANVAFDDITRPVILYVLPASGYLYREWHQTTDAPMMQVAFLCKTDFDFKSEENDRLMQRMKELAIQFIDEVNKSNLFVRINEKTRIQYQAVYDLLDENVTGIIISLELRELQGVKHCS